jgi:hypothetical protein
LSVWHQNQASSNNININNNMLYSKSLCNPEGGAVHGGETFEKCSILLILSNN